MNRIKMKGGQCFIFLALITRDSSGTDTGGQLRN